MKLRNVLTVFGTATATAVLTLLLFAPWSGSAQAGPAVKPVIAQPQLSAKGCTFTLKTDKASYEAGETPKIEVQAGKPTDKPVDVSVWVAASATAPVSPASRMLPIPQVVWSHEYAFHLAPGETKPMSADWTALPAGKSIAITLTDKDGAVLMGSFGVPTPGGPNSVQSPVASK